jgi:hypothetical protein
MHICNAVFISELAIFLIHPVLLSEHIPIPLDWKSPKVVSIRPDIAINQNYAEVLSE